ncbi:hypothetical protein K440DRAFT_609178 [Wilcoxina mikolae CBS 423.85]|nr:hypothetical protein K440DRAFT_609178 [Wilcoxina mikolae CBS 423.85]
MSFGYSVGDFLGVIKLACDIAKALSDSRGASTELKRLIEMLDSLTKAVNHAVQTVDDWERAYPNAANNAPRNALIEEHHICRRLLEKFWKDSEKYTQSIVNGQGSRVKREMAKIKWCMFRNEDAVVLEHNLKMHVLAINMYSSDLRCRILRDIASTNSSMLNENALTLKDSRMLLEKFDNRLQSIQKSIEQLSISKPVPMGLGDPWEGGYLASEAPLKLLDALGRELLVPLYLASSFTVFHDILEIMHRNQPGHAKILQREYRLAEEDTNGALIGENNWFDTVKPGMSISLSMVLRRPYTNSRRCPRCSMICQGPELSGNRLRCTICQVTFRIFAEDRIVEEPYAPAAPPSIQSRENVKRSLTKPNSSDTWRDEDVFRRVHIIRIDFNYSRAVNFVNKVKSLYSQQTEVYKNVLGILQKYQRESISIQDVYSQVTQLLHEVPDLLQDFEEFFPVSLAQTYAAAEYALHGPGGATSGGSPIGELMGQGPVEFNHAMSYVKHIKSLYSHQSEIYKNSLRILETYQRESLPAPYAYSQITQLLHEAPDLQHDLKQVLPERAARAHTHESAEGGNRQ